MGLCGAVEGGAGPASGGVLLWSSLSSGRSGTFFQLLCSLGLEKELLDGTALTASASGLTTSTAQVLLLGFSFDIGRNRFYFLFISRTLCSQMALIGLQNNQLFSLCGVPD